MRVACIVPTFNGRIELVRLLNSIQTQTTQFDTYIVDSSSKDGTQETARTSIGQVTVIPSADFNHGGTRQLMIDKNPGYDVYVLLTQDACLADPESIERILEPFDDPQVGAVCGRQLPHLDASPLAQHARLFNYPEGVEIKTIADVPKLGIKTAFMSNSFAAYRGEALRAAGGFPVHVIFAEDMYVVAKMLIGGWKIAYAGNAICRHSHNYTIVEEFQRYFDMGVFHAREPWIRKNFGGAGGEGLRYVRSELKYLGLSKLYYWPESLLRNAVKLFGYKIGQKESKLPICVKRRLSMYKRYWDSVFADI